MAVGSTLPLASGLATLVETEARLDLALARARETAQGLRELARQRAENAATLFDAEIARERARVAAQVEVETKARLGAIAEHARAELARYAAVRGEVLGSIVHDLVERLVVLALEVPA